MNPAIKTNPAFLPTLSQGLATIGSNDSYVSNLLISESEDPLSITLDSTIGDSELLNEKQRKILSKYLQNGGSRKLTALECNVTPQTVSNILASQPAQDYLMQYSKDFDRDVNAMQGMVFDVMRDALSDDDINIRLKGADRCLKVLDKFNPKQINEPQMSGSQIMQQVLININNS